MGRGGMRLAHSHDVLSLHDKARRDVNAGLQTVEFPLGIHAMFEAIAPPPPVRIEVNIQGGHEQEACAPFAPYPAHGQLPAIR